MCASLIAKTHTFVYKWVNEGCENCEGWHHCTAPLITGVCKVTLQNGHGNSVSELLFSQNKRNTSPIYLILILSYSILFYSTSILLFLPSPFRPPPQSPPQPPHPPIFNPLKRGLLRNRNEELQPCPPKAPRHFQHQSGLGQLSTLPHWPWVQPERVSIGMNNLGLRPQHCVAEERRILINLQIRAVSSKDGNAWSSIRSQLQL